MCRAGQIDGASCPHAFLLRDYRVHRLVASQLPKPPACSLTLRSEVGRCQVQQLTPHLYLYLTNSAAPSKGVPKLGHLSLTLHVFPSFTYKSMFGYTSLVSSSVLPLHISRNRAGRKKQHNISYTLHFNFSIFYKKIQIRPYTIFTRKKLFFFNFKIVIPNHLNSERDSF